MNPYKQLNKLANAVALSATLTRTTGTSRNLRVLPESLETAALSNGASLPGALAVRAWSCDAADLRNDAGLIDLPSEGDVLRVVGGDETTRAYRVARDSATGAVAKPRYLRAGTRVQFFTRFNPES